MKYDAYTARKVHAALVAAENAARDSRWCGNKELKLWIQLMDARVDHEVYGKELLEEAK